MSTRREKSAEIGMFHQETLNYKGREYLTNLSKSLSELSRWIQTELIPALAIDKNGAAIWQDYQFGAAEIPENVQESLKKESPNRDIFNFIEKLKNPEEISRIYTKEKTPADLFLEVKDALFVIDSVLYRVKKTEK